MKKPNHNLIYEYRLPYGPLCSPTGRFAAYGVKQAVQEANGYSFRIHVLDLESGQERIVNESWNCPYYFWDGDDELLLAKKEDGKTAFLKWSPNLSQIEPAFQIPKNCIGAKLLKASAPEHAKNGDDLLLLIRENMKTEHAETLSHSGFSVIDELPYWANGAGYVNGMRNRLYLYCRASGTLTRISGETQDVVLYEVCEQDIAVDEPAGNSRSIGENSENTPAVIYTACEFDGNYNDRPGIYRYHTASCIRETLLAPGEFYVRLLCSTENSVLFSGSRGETYGKYQYDGFYRKTDCGWQLFARHEANTGLCSIISDTLTGMGQKAKISGGLLYFLSTVDDRCGLYCLDTKTGRISEIPTGCAAVESFDILPAGHLGQARQAGQARRTGCSGGFLLCGTDEAYPSELWLLPPSDQKRRLTSYQDILRNEVLLSRREELTFQNSDGIKIRGWVMRPLPADDKPPCCEPTDSLGTQYAAVFCIHGGPRSVYGDVYYHEMQLLAAAGYFVCFYNGRGSDSRGNSFGNINGKYGHEDMDDLMEFTDRILLRYPEIDPKRLGLAGGSYGGYLVNWVLGHSTRFAAAVSQRSISNWITQEALSDIGYYYVPDQAGASLISGEADRLWDNSPLKYAGQIETPLLLLHSDEDRRCGLPEAQQMFYVLKRRNISCQLVIFHGENHELNKNGKPQNRISRIEKILEWMKQYL